MDSSVLNAVMNSGVAQEAESLWFRWDHMVTETTLKIFEELGWKQIRAPAVSTKNLPFVKTPTLLVTSIIAYLVIVGVTFLKRSLFTSKEMLNGVKKQDPVWLRLLIQLHNAFLVALSAFMFLGTVYQARKNGYNVWGNTYREEETGMAYMLYTFYISKIYEFTDTVDSFFFIMLLKGNIHQVSFLHVYHHVSISVVWWFLVYSVPGGDTYYTCALNSFVHILMYSYYFLASILGKDQKKKAKYLWWGKYMTLFQMAQFVSMMCQALYCYIYSKFPTFLCIFLFVYMQTLLVLFANFYLRKHVLAIKKKVN